MKSIPDLPNTDVLVVIGANDVVNPAAEDDPSSPIYGMPIIKAHDAKNIIVHEKRGMGKGYAAIEKYVIPITIRQECYLAMQKALCKILLMR